MKTMNRQTTLFEFGLKIEGQTQLTDFFPDLFGGEE
tara:strand:- start:1201 stop:1308 length:108 start_codon:yes stop_codon:yes gene_type:complete